jgi:N6-adenosine-specific RNA methylase IME4
MAALATLPLAAVAAKDAFLFFWVTGPFLALGAHIPVMRAWGFKPCAIAFDWVKLNPNAPTLLFSERDFFFGGGLTTRANAEYVVLGRRGNPKRLALSVSWSLRRVIASTAASPTRSIAASSGSAPDRAWNCSRVDYAQDGRFGAIRRPLRRPMHSIPMRLRSPRRLNDNL